MMRCTQDQTGQIIKHEMMITLKCLLWGQFESEGTDAKTTGKTADEKDLIYSGKSTEI